MKFSIRLLYLYLFSFIGLLTAVIGSVQLADLALKIYLFKGADIYEIVGVPSRIDLSGKEVKMSKEELAEQKRLQEAETKRQRQRQASSSIAMLLVGIPLYKYHWSLIKKESKKRK